MTLYSALAPGYTDAGAVVAQIQAEMGNFDAPKTVKFDYTGQLEEQIWKHKDLLKYSSGIVEAYGKKMNTKN